MFGQKIETVQDFKETIGSHSHRMEEWFSPFPEVEASIRHAIDEIFNDLPNMSSDDERKVISLFLDSVDTPWSAPLKRDTKS